MCVHVCNCTQMERNNNLRTSPGVSPLTPGVLGLLSRRWLEDSSTLSLLLHFCYNTSVNCHKLLHFVLFSNNEKVSVHINSGYLFSLMQFNESWGRAAKECRGCSVQNRLWGPLFHGIKPVMWTSEITGQHLTNFWHRERSLAHGVVSISG